MSGRAPSFLPVQEQWEIMRRGCTHVETPTELQDKLKKSYETGTPLRVKLGIDPTSPDIHLGHTIPLRKLRQFQDCGHHVVLIIGDATALIGDPTGRSATRPRLTRDQILANAKTYQEQAFKVLRRENCEVVYNSTWLSKLGYAELIELTSKITVARMLERDDFSRRYKSGTPISLHELLYPLMQGFDSVEVKADVELGATEQLFNLLVGRDLQRIWGQPAQVAMTLPILVGLDGKQRMSKSTGNYVGVTEAPVQMFGKLMSIPDTVIAEYMRLLTAASEESIREWETRMRNGQLNPRDAKAEVAREIVKTFHGAHEAVRASAEFDRVFKEKQLPADMPELTLDPAELAEGGIGLPKLLVRAGLAPSNREAHRLIQQGGVTLDGTPHKDPKAVVQPRSGAVLQVGPRRFVRLQVGNPV